MKRAVYVIGALAALIAAVFPAMSEAGRGPGFGEMHTSIVQGDVLIKTRDTSDWVPASINMPLREGDRIWVPQGGRVELYRRDGTAVRLDENTALELLGFDKDSLQLYLAEGRAYVNYRAGRDGVFQMDGPLMSLRCYDLTRFGVDTARDGDTGISVYKGIVYAESAAGRTEIPAGRNLALRDDAYADLSPLGPADEWERWNRDRDDRYASPSTYRSYRYLPDDLRPYAYDFDTYGGWTYTGDYGYVWTPSLQISIGWAPYREGRWVWFGGDYVWISYDPWGWVPHHYGRWVFRVSLGWCWVPPVRAAIYWSPGYVGWVYTPQHVAWVPLAPGDTYYGYGNYGPHSVNIFNVNINNVRVTKIYKNVHVQDAVTTVNRNTFVSGRGERAVIRENLFLRERVSPGSPRINPEKSSFMPVVKDVSAAKHPPQAIKDLRQEELKHRRPVVKERSISVLKPQVPQRSMPLRVYDKPKGSESRTYVERESLPGKKARPADAVRGDGKVKQETEAVRRQKGQEKKPEERLRERPAASPQVVPQPQAVPPRQGDNRQKSVIEQQKPRDTQPKGQDGGIREKGVKPPETPKGKDLSPRVPDRPSSEGRGSKRAAPEMKGSRESTDRRAPAEAAAPPSREREVKRAPGGGEPRAGAPAAPQDKKGDAVKPNGGKGERAAPKSSGTSSEEEEQNRRAREREKTPGGYPFQERR